STTPFRTELAGHLDDRSHRHAVGDVTTPKRRRTRERADIHDRPAPPREHPPPCLLAHREAADNQVLRSSGLDKCPSPPILPRKSTRRNEASICRNNLATASGSETSVRATSVFRPRARICSAVAWAPTRFRSTRTTSAPCCATASAVACPMP